MIKLMTVLEVYRGGIPRLLYHATFSVFLPEIESDGLVPNGDGISINFDNIPSGVYLSSDKEFSISMAEASENEDNLKYPIVVLTIDIYKIDNKKLFATDPNVALPNKKGYAKSFIYSGIIPPSAIIDYDD